MTLVKGVFLEAFLTAMLVFVILMLAAEKHKVRDGCCMIHSFQIYRSQSGIACRLHSWLPSALASPSSPASSSGHFGQDVGALRVVTSLLQESR